MRKRFVDRVEALRSVEHGFTLLELLIAMVVLSILMATASQYYFHHRRKAWEAQVRASVRNMAGAQNYFVFNEGGFTFTHDLDDLYLVGYRWNDKSLRPYVALATNQTFCVQVHSANDPSIVWHFSSEIGHPQPGPATPEDCGDPEVLGLYIAGLPPDSVGRDGQLSNGGTGTTEWLASLPSDWNSSADGESSVEEGEFGPGGSGTGAGSGSGTGTEGAGGSGGTGTGSGDGSTTTGSVPGYGTSDTTSGTVPGDTTGATTPTDGCSGAGTGSGSTSGNNHPSGNDRGTESGGSGDQGGSDADPDGDENDGADKTGGSGGADTGDQDGNNGSGNDSDFEDDNRGPDQDGTPTPGSGC